MEPIQLNDLVISEQTDSGVRIIKFSGRITNSNSYELNHNFQKILDDENYNIIIDLSELEYVNSTGVAIIFTLFYKATEKNGQVCIGGVHPFLNKVFSLMSLPDGLKVHNDLKSAISSY
ncbi:MAG: STAS domain-containing protein [Leptonema sp. (in: Bacteria)]|nr:STAS domain-containing protein [Leptonema sp. (in: bacteria)]